VGEARVLHLTGEDECLLSPQMQSSAKVCKKIQCSKGFEAQLYVQNDRSFFVSKVKGRMQMMCIYGSVWSKFFLDGMLIPFTSS
jgi:hypothetical protein